MEFTYDDPYGRLRNKTRLALEERFINFLARCQTLLPGPVLSDFHIVVRKGENSRKLPVEGLGSKGCITVILDTKWPVYRNPSQNKGIEGAIAHEWHHHVRETGIGRDTTLAQRIVSEGLAQRFEVEATGYVPHTAVAVSRKRLSEMQGCIKCELRRKSEDYLHDVFSGGRGSGFPKWFGYSFSYRIVENWLDATKETASKMVNVEATRIIRSWHEGKILPFAARP